MHTSISEIRNEAFFEGHFFLSLLSHKFILKYGFERKCGKFEWRLKSTIHLQYLKKDINVWPEARLSHTHTQHI